MPALIRPGTVKVITQDGEVHVLITLDLNINLNNDRITTSSAVETVKDQLKKKEENTEWEIPDFGTSPKLNFGKNIE